MVFQPRRSQSQHAFAAESGSHHGGTRTTQSLRLSLLYAHAVTCLQDQRLISWSDPIKEGPPPLEIHSALSQRFILRRLTLFSCCGIVILLRNRKSSEGGSECNLLWSACTGLVLRC